MGPDRPLTDAEYKVMAVVWERGGEAPAKDIHEALSQKGYDRASTYQLIHRCIGKGALERIEPGFICRSLVDQSELQVSETRKLIDRVFGGSPERLLVALVNPNATSQKEIEHLRSLINTDYLDSGTITE